MSLPITKNEQEISLYGEGKVNPRVLADCIIKLKRSFPKLPIGWYEVLSEMLVEEKFTDKRLIDATNNLIRTCIYPEPTIANILSFDKKVNLWTYDEALEYSKEFTTEARKKFWDNMELVNKDKKLWRMK